jgi:hypothetical protein
VAISRLQVAKAIKDFVNRFLEDVLHVRRWRRARRTPRAH